MNSENDSDEKKDFAKKFISYLPLLTLLALGVSIINEEVFYYPFHLDILTYTDINEIIFDTLNNLVGGIFVLFISQFFVQIFLQFVYYHIIRIFRVKAKKLGIDIKDRVKDSKGEGFSIKELNIVMIIATTILTILFIVLLIEIRSSNLSDSRELSEVNQLLPGYAYTSTQFYVPAVVLYITFFLAILVGIYFKHYYENTYFKVLDRKFQWLLATAILVLGLTVSNSLISSLQLRSYATYGTYVEIGTKKIVSNEKYYYIGRTKNFIFFYNTANNHTDIYQNKDISVLSTINVGFNSKSVVSKVLSLKADSLKKKIDVIYNETFDSMKNDYFKKIDILKNKTNGLIDKDGDLNRKIDSLTNGLKKKFNRLINKKVDSLYNKMGVEYMKIDSLTMRKN